MPRLHRGEKGLTPLRSTKFYAEIAQRKSTSLRWEEVGGLSPSLGTIYALVVKRISRNSTKVLLGVRVPPRAPSFVPNRKSLYSNYIFWVSLLLGSLQ
jgi:hypothetical protein